MPAACVCTSACDHRSKANAIDLRSCSRNSGLMCAAKLTISSGPGKVTSSWSPPVLADPVLADAVLADAVLPWAEAGGPAGPQSHVGGGASPARELQSR